MLKNVCFIFIHLISRSMFVPYTYTRYSLFVESWGIAGLQVPKNARCRNRVWIHQNKKSQTNYIDHLNEIQYFFG